MISRHDARSFLLISLTAGSLLASLSACTADDAAPGASAPSTSAASSAASTKPEDASSSPSPTPPPPAPSSKPGDGGPPSADVSSAPGGDDLPPPIAADQRARGKGSGAYDLVLTDVRVGAHSGYDRVVMEFRGSGTPGWRVRYVRNPRLDGSGDRVRLGGDSALSIVADRTTYPAEEDTYYDGPARLPGAGAAIADAYVGGTFEGYTAVFAGVTGQKPPFRVFRLTDPVRLVVDVASGS